MFVQLIQNVSCNDVAFSGLSVQRLEAQEAETVGLDAAYWWKITTTSPQFPPVHGAVFGEDSATGVVYCKVGLSNTKGAEGAAYAFRLDFFQAPTIRYVEPSSG